MRRSREVRFLERRDRLSIYLGILQAIHTLSRQTGWAKFTRVVYVANLNHKILKERLQELSYLDMVVWNEHGLKLTDKGYCFLKELHGVLEKYGIPVKL
jgi:predicted transcriptional regulator